ncbi:MAG TPA: branched-chain amino acid ABC transporter permease [Gaiella sp.]|uniref:branched-chain amino acid ABC transporter permease n=1 Tax=Gaiella sp. TaxID=2663207 RepID=UPI002D810BF4|nr:branched-chain amino acid ABC transporter permease [Gaiella sp.]HET9287351.1 branched-chain amino acid ABC transporter permease [Gaiella sp.]
MASALARLRASSVTDKIGLSLVGLLIFWLAVNFVKDPTEFVNVGLIGLTNGSIYGVVALGYTLVYGILQLINFAHGDVFALSGLFASTIIVSVLGLDTDSSVPVIVGGMLLTLVVVMSLFSIVNATIERVAYKPLRHAPRLAPLITAIGVSFIVQNVALAFYGVNFRSVPNFIPTSDVIDIGGITYTWKKLTAILIVVPLLLLLTWFVRTTRQGKAMRAVAQDREASAMMGIDVNRTISVTFMIAGALAGAAGIVYLLQFNMRYDTGFELGLIAFTAAVLGGIGNLTGAVLGAIIIGLIQAFNEGLTWLAPGSDWTRTIVFGILILILVFRPEGLLGERTPEGA